MSQTTSDAQAIIGAVRDLHEPKVVLINPENNLGVLATPGGVKVTSLKPFLDEYLDAPERRAGTATLGDLPSFIEHAKRFADPDSAVFANRSEASPFLLSVLDYHPAGPDNAAARFGKHRGLYKFPTSEAWEAWRKIDGQMLKQADFAAFVEERIMDVQAPPAGGKADMGALALDLVATLGGEMAGPAKLLEVARGLRMTETAEVANAQNLASGEVEVVYRTTHTNAQGQPLKVPSLFLVAVPVFDGDAAYRMPVRLQYRRAEGRILWTLRRYRPDLVFFDAFDRATDRVRQETGLPLFIGAPEA